MSRSSNILHNAVKRINNEVKAAAEVKIVRVEPGGIGWSRTLGDRLQAEGLGSGVAVVALVPGGAGLLRVVCPVVVPRRGKRPGPPGMFADTGVPLFLEEVSRIGKGDLQGLAVKLVGGASILGAPGMFDLGGRILADVRKALGEAGIMVAAEDVGGNWNRTVTVDVGQDRIRVYSPGRGYWWL